MQQESLYQSARSRAIMVSIGLWAFLIVALATVICGFFISSSGASTLNSFAEVHPLIAIVYGLLLIFRALLLLVTCVFFLMWVHRIHRNLPELVSANLRTTPGWAVGWYFVPIAWLFKPYQGMKDAWNACDPEGRFDALEWADRPGAPLVKWWWGIWLIMNITSGFITRMQYSDSTSLTTSTHLGMFNGALWLIVTVLALILVNRLTARQDKKWEVVSEEARLRASIGA